MKCRKRQAWLSAEGRGGVGRGNGSSEDEEDLSQLSIRPLGVTKHYLRDHNEGARVTTTQWRRAAKKKMGLKKEDGQSG